MSRFYKIYTLIILAVFAALTFTQSVNADPIWTKRDTPSYTDTDTLSYVNGSFTKMEIYNADLGLLTLNTHYRYGKDTESLTQLWDKDADTKICVVANKVDDVTNPIMNNGSHIELTYTAGWQYHRPLQMYSITTGNDSPERDPNDWTIYGSNDGGITWDTLTTVTNAAIPAATTGTEFKQMYDFPISTKKAYSQYKVDFTGSRSDNIIFQISEFSFWTDPIITDTTQNLADNDFGTYVPLKATGYLAIKDGASVISSNSTYSFGGGETIEKLVDLNIPESDSVNKTKLCAVGKGDTSNFFNNVDSFSIDFSKTSSKSATGKEQSLHHLDYVVTEYAGLNAYAITTANDAKSNPTRNPDSWTLYGSNDNTNWVVLDEISGANLPADNFQMCTIPLPEGTNSYQNYRLTITDTLGTNTCLQFSEFSVWETPKAVQYRIPADKINNVTLTYNASGWWYGTNEGIANLIDGLSNKMCMGGLSADKANFPSATNPVVITLEMTDPVAIGSYSLTTANDSPNRDPSSWTLYGSVDGDTWTMLDAITDFQMTDDRYTSQNFSVNNPLNEEYSLYKFEFTNIKDITTANGFQLGEITLFGPTVELLPEPSSLCLLGLGFLGLIGYRRKRTNK